MNIGLCVLAVSFVALVAYLWNDRLRRVPLAAFGLNNVQRVGDWQTAEWRDRVWARGWITNAEWRAANKRQLDAIVTELRQRGIEITD
jgi:hypothetical protein